MYVFCKLKYLLKPQRHQDGLRSLYDLRRDLLQSLRLRVWRSPPFRPGIPRHSMSCEHATQRPALRGQKKNRYRNQSNESMRSKRMWRGSQASADKAGKSKNSCYLFAANTATFEDSSTPQTNPRGIVAHDFRNRLQAKLAYCGIGGSVRAQSSHHSCKKRFTMRHQVQKLRQQNKEI